jgi:hypothetical protein
MRTASILSRFRVSALAAAAVLTLGACDSDPLREESLFGVWAATQAPQPNITVNYWLELDEDGSFEYRTEMYGPAGRPADHLLESVVILGDWEVRGDRLALREETGTRWTHGAGESQLDFLGEWNTQRRMQLHGDALSITYIPRPEQSISQYTLVYQRMLGGVFD